MLQESCERHLLGVSLCTMKPERGKISKLGLPIRLDFHSFNSVF